MFSYVRPDNSVGATLSHTDTREQLDTRLESDRKYYIRLGYNLRPADVREVCKECCGAGDRQHKTNRFRRIKCKACKATGVVRDMTPEFNFDL